MPNSAPQLTCVVETGLPIKLAPITTRLVTKLAVKPWPWFIGVIFWLIISATRRALSNPPRAIASPTSVVLPKLPKAGTINNSAAILGVSFKPRAKLTAPAER